MKILAGVFAFSLLAAPALAQPGNTPPPPPPAGADQGKPTDDSMAPGDETSDAAKPPATPEPEQAPEGTTPVKPPAPPQG